MSGSDDPLAAVADELREAREALLHLVADLPETRIYRPLGRAGWTIKHELSHVAARDAELLHRIESGARGLPALEDVAARRLRGQAMHAAQELRLGPLREHLAALGGRVARALAGAESALAAEASEHAAGMRRAAEAIREAMH